MSVKIESTGLFVEAAYGQDGLPGSGGVTGAGESHDVAWKQALSDASLQLLSNGSSAGAIDQTGIGISGPDQGLDDSLGFNMGAQANPVSWDRLSMTVASMVAWNMSVGIADDVLADSIEETGVSELVLEDEILAGSSDLHDIGLGEKDSTIEPMQSSAVPVSTIEEPPSPSKDEYLGADQGTEDGTEFKEFKGLYAGTEPAELNKRQTPIASEIFREGSEANQSLEGLQSESTDTYEVGSRYPMDVRVGTTPDDAANSIMKGMASASGSEIPPTYQTDHSEKNESMDAKLQSKSAADNGSRMPGKGRGDPLDGIIRVRSSSTVDPEVAAGKQRLEGIRQVLGQLEVQAKMNTMAAKIQESTQAVQQPQSAASQVVASTVATQKTNLSKGMPSVNQAGAPTQASVTTPTNENGEDTRSFGIAIEDIDTPEAAQRPESLTSKPKIIVSTRPQSQTQSAGGSEIQTTQTEFTAAVAGAENAEIASDELTLLEGIEFDVENIDANEIPEMMVQDPSQLDVEIDDVAGTVRLEMTRDGEEVTVRMETPQEVLDSYREMEEEMGGALADQGLDLSEFSAEARNPEDDDLENDGKSDQKESRQGGADTGSVGSQDLEQTGATARLVNHIV